MSDDQDKDSKTEEPSDKKIQDALDKGNVPFSKEITSVVSIFAIVIIGYFYIPVFTKDLVAVLRSMFANLGDWPLDQPVDALNIANAIGINLIVSMAPIIVPLIIFGLLSSLSQNTPSFVLNRLAPKMERISLPKGIKRLLGWHGVREFLKSMFKFSAAGLVATIVCISQAEFILSLMMVDAVQIPANMHSLFLQVALGLGMTVVTLGIVDLIWVRHEWYDNLKMTHQEVKDERKQAEGDPNIKMRVNSLARDRARRRMITQVDEATLVVTNPTHFAVAMRYDPIKDNAPIVLAKGQDLIGIENPGTGRE